MPELTRREKLLKWIEALRSGEYKQCTGQFHLGDRHCCLGVAQIIGDLKASYSELETYYELDYHNDLITFENLNDVDRRTFPQIADYIEEHYLNEEKA